MIRMLQSWIPPDNDIPLYATANDEYNVDTSNVVYGKWYSTIDEDLPGSNMTTEYEVEDVCSVAVSFSYGEALPGPLCITILWDNGAWPTRTIWGAACYHPSNPAITAHLERISGEDVVIIDVVYEGYPTMMSNDGDILHFRIRQASEGNEYNFVQVYPPYTLNSPNEQYCHHPDIVYDARSWGSAETPPYLYCIYESGPSPNNAIHYAAMPDRPYYQHGQWTHDVISDNGAIYPRLDVGNVLVDTGQEELMLWSIVAVWMEQDTGWDIRWSWGFVGGPPDIFSDFVPDAPDFDDHPYWDKFVPFVDIAPWEYHSIDESSIHITYTQMQDFNNDNHFDAAALYAAVDNIDLQQPLEWYGFCISAAEKHDEGLPQIAVDATGAEFDAMIVYLKVLEENGTVPHVHYAWTDWSDLQDGYLNGVYGQSIVPGGNQTPTLPYYDDTITPSVSLCLTNSYRVVWTDNRNQEQGNLRDVYAKYWHP